MSSSNSSGGIGFFGLLTIVFVVLKLTNNIAWSWWWVLSPLWLPISIVVGCLLVWLVGIYVWGGIAILNEKLTTKTKGKK